MRWMSAVLGVALAVSAACSTPKPPAPSLLEPTQTVAASAKPAPNELVNFGFAIRPKTGSVVLIDVDVVGATPGLEIVRIAVVRPRTGHQVGVLYGDLEGKYPDRYEIVTIEGAELAASADDRVIAITVRADEPGVYSTRGLRIAFHANSRSALETLPIQISIEVRDKASTTVSPSPRT